jgi:hypothetical protein
VHRHAAQPPAGPRDGVEGLGCLGELAAGHAVASHRGELLEDEAGLRVPGEQRGEVLGPADGVHHPRGRAGVEVQRGTEGSPRREDQEVAGVAAGRGGHLVVGADGQDVDR